MGVTKHVLLAIAIGVLSALFIGYGINTFYPEPNYEDYCDEFLRSKPFPVDRDVEGCRAVEQNNRDYENDCYKDRGQPRYDYGEDQCRVYKECDFCQKEYDDVRDLYNRNVFVIAVILGITLIIVGGVILKLESVSSGLMGGGIIITLYGTLRYWGNMHDYLRFVVLGLVLFILIWIGYKKLKK